MDEALLSVLLPIIYVILKVVFVVFSFRLAVWLTLYLIRWKTGVHLTFSGVWFASVHQVRVQWSRGELGINDLHLSICWRGAIKGGHWVTLGAAKVYCVARDDAVAAPQQPNTGKLPGFSKRRSRFGKHLRKVLLFLLHKACKFVDVAIGNIHVDWPCLATPPVSGMVSVQDLTLSSSRQQEVMSVVCKWRAVLARLVHDSAQPTPNTEDILKAVLKGQVVVQLAPSTDRPIRLLQFTIVPVNISVTEELPLLLARGWRLRKGGGVMKNNKINSVNDRSQDCTTDNSDNTTDNSDNTTDNSDNTTGDGGGTSVDSSASGSSQHQASPFLPLTTEVLLEDLTLVYATSSGRKLSAKMSRLLLSSHSPPGSLSLSGECSVHRLKVSLGSSEVAVSTSVVRHTYKYEVSPQQLSSCTVVDSLRGVLREKDLLSWAIHIREMTVAAAAGSGSGDSDGGDGDDGDGDDDDDDDDGDGDGDGDSLQRSLSSRSLPIIKTIQSLMRKLPLSTSITATFEAIGWQVDCYLGNTGSTTPLRPFSQLTLASFLSTTHIPSLAPSPAPNPGQGQVAACRSAESSTLVCSQTRHLKQSFRMEDVYICCPGNHGASWSKPGSPSLLPSSQQHVWGRVVSMGTCFVELELELCNMGANPESKRKGLPLQVGVVSEIGCCALEWSPVVSDTIKDLVGYLQQEYGLLATASPGPAPPPESSWLPMVTEVLGGSSVQLQVHNANLIVTEPADRLQFVMVLHSDRARVSGSGGGDFPHAVTSCPADRGSPCLDLELKGCVLSCETFEEPTKSFPCLMMKDLPPGLLEVPLLSASTKASGSVWEVALRSGDFAANWTTSAHLSAKYILSVLHSDLSAILESIPVLKKVLTQSAHTSDTPTQPKPLPLSQLAARLSDRCSLTIDVAKVTINTTVNKVFRFSAVATGNSVSLGNGSVQCAAKEVEGIFDKHRILHLQDLRMRLMNPDTDGHLFHRDSFPGLASKTNTSIELASTALTLDFPQGYKFCDAFEKFMAIRKFLHHVHSSPTSGPGPAPSPTSGPTPSPTSGPGPAPSPYLLPDLYLSCDLFSFQLHDEEFEAKLRSKLFLMSSDWSHNLEFVKALQLKIEEIELQQGKRLSSKRKQELYDSLESQLYCDRAKMFYSQKSPESKLFEVCFHGMQLALLSDPTLAGRDSLLRQMRDIDPKSPLPPSLGLTTQWGCCMRGHCHQFQLLFRDFPNPLLSQSDLSVSGRTLLVEEEAIERATRPITIHCDGPWSDITVVKKMAAVKLYHDWDWSCKQSVGSWGSSYEPVMAQVNLAFENIVKRSIDPSKPLPFWDKMRLAFHGSLKMAAAQAQLLLLASRDPYDTAEHLSCQFSHLNLLYDTGLLKLSGGVDVYMHTATKYNECQILHVPKATFQTKLKWVCKGDPNAHHGVMPCHPAKTPPLPEGQVFDSFAEFRSQNLNLELMLELQPAHNKGSQASKQQPTLVLYASMLRWLQSFVETLLRRVSRPVRKGPLFGNVRPKRTPFSRNIKEVELSLSCCHSALCYWGSVVQQRGAWVRVGQGRVQLSYTLALVPFNTGMAQRPRADWTISSCQGNGEDIRVLVCNGEDRNVERAPDFYQHLKPDQNKFQHFFTMTRCGYQRVKPNSSDGSLSPDLQLTVEYTHQLQTLNTRVLWTNITKDVVFRLYETYTSSQELKDNLMSDALKPSRLSDQPQHSPMEGIYEGKSPSSHGTSPNGPPRDNRHRSPGSSLLAQLILDVNRHVEHCDERDGGRDPELRGKQACTTDDIAEQTWLIQLRTTQVAFQGVETGGCVLVSSGVSHVTCHKHCPQLSLTGAAVEKTAWIARVEDMQYFATAGADVPVAEGNNIPWLSSSTISWEHPDSAPSNDDIGNEHEAEHDITNILISTLGPQTASHASLSPTLSSESIKGPIFSDRSGGRHGDSVGGLVVSTARGVEGEYIHLQRVATHCFCQIFFTRHSVLEDLGSLAVPPSGPPKECTDIFTIRHPSVEVSTTSSQYGMLLDILNNVLLYTEPSKRAAIDRRNRIKFSLELSNIEDYRLPILTRQEKSRQLIKSIRQLERELFLALTSHDNPESVAKLRSGIRDAKDQLKETNQELSVLISLYKQGQQQSGPGPGPSPRPPSSHRPPAVLCVEVWLDEAHWSTRDRDGQIELARVHLTNCRYNRLMFSDDSGEHCFELEDLKVQDLAPNALYRDILFPLDYSLRVDKSIRLRVFTKDKAPVAGITVKEHFEVNVAPLAVQLTAHFYNSLFEFFFPSRGGVDDQTGGTSSDKAQMIIGTAGKQSKGQEKRGEESLELDKKGKKKQGSGEGGRRKGENVSDVDRMSERALEVKTFLYVKIPKVPLRISYHGRQGGIPIDIDNFNVSTPTLEYHSQNWTWKDMFMAVKKDCKQAIIPKAIKTKLGMESSSEASNQDTTTSRVNLLGLSRVSGDGPRSSKKLFSIGRRGNS